MRAAGPAEQLKDSKQEDGQAELTGKPPQIQEGQIVHVLKREGNVEAARGDQLPQDPLQSGPLRYGAPGQGLGQSQQQAFAKHTEVVGPAPVHREMGQHGGLQGVGYSTALHPSQKTCTLAILRQIQPGPLLQRRGRRDKREYEQTYYQELGHFGMLLILMACYFYCQLTC